MPPNDSIFSIAIITVPSVLLIAFTTAWMSTPPTYPKPLSVPSLKTHTSTFIFLHGKGDSGSNIAVNFLSQDFTLFLPPNSCHQTTTSKYTGNPIISLQSLLPHTKFIFPSAPVRPDKRFKQSHPQWFEVWSLMDMQLQEDIQLQGLEESVCYVQELVEKEVEGLGGDGRNVVVGGLSQGCATGVLAALTGKTRLGGVVGLSGWIPLAKRFLSFEKKAEEDKLEGTRLQSKVLSQILGEIKLPAVDEAGVEEAMKTPAFFGHGEMDNTIDIDLGHELTSVVKGLQMQDVTWKSYKELSHWYNEYEWWDIVNWLHSHGFGGEEKVTVQEAKENFEAMKAKAGGGNQTGKDGDRGC